MVKIGRAVAREVVNLKRLDHPNVIKLLDYDLEYDVPYLVVEYHPGGHITKENLSKFDLDEKEKIAKKVLDAARYCRSKGMDVYSADNIVLTSDHEPIIIDMEFPDFDLKRFPLTAIPPSISLRLFWAPSGY